MILTELMWDLPNESIVSVDHWMSPGISASLMFLASFAPYARLLKYRVRYLKINLTVHSAYRTGATYKRVLIGETVAKSGEKFRHDGSYYILCLSDEL